MSHFYTPFWYQDKANDAIFNFFNNGSKGNPLVTAPTGSGKSVMIADFCRRVKEKWPSQRILVLAHDAEILVQDHKSIERQNPSYKIGLYSAGLKSRTIESITVAGIQSAYKKPELFNHFDIVLLDEAHTVSYDPKSMYRKFLNALGKRVVGFTATPFRLGTGYLHIGKDAMFSDIVFTISIETLQKEKKLCNITSKQPLITLDASQIKKQEGDFIIKELSMAFDRELITTEIVQELVQYKDVRKKWMVYAIDIDHAEHITESLNNAGIKTAVLHSKLKVGRNIILDKFRAGKYQAVVSVAMLTTGVDIPEVDLIVLLRPTSSPVLHVQIIGRGMRINPADIDADCLVLDFAGNLLRNGPIDSPVIKLKGKGGGEAIMKVCEGCNEIVPIATRTCKICGATFEFKHGLSAEASQDAVMAVVEWHKVDDVTYDVRPSAKNGTPLLWVYYQCGLRQFKESVCIEHRGHARTFAKRWWERRSSLAGVPDTASEACNLKNSLKRPIRIKVDESGKYNSIKEHEFKDRS